MKINGLVSISAVVALSLSAAACSSHVPTPTPPGIFEATGTAGGGASAAHTTAQASQSPPPPAGAPRNVCLPLTPDVLGAWVSASDAVVEGTSNGKITDAGDGLVIVQFRVDKVLTARAGVDPTTATGLVLGPAQANPTVAPGRYLLFATYNGTGDFELAGEVVALSGQKVTKLCGADTDIHGFPLGCSPGITALPSLEAEVARHVPRTPNRILIPPTCAAAPSSSAASSSSGVGASTSP